MARPFVSILIDTYNHERFIEQAIVSVLEQDFPISEREIIVLDDGSTDHTPELIRKFGLQVRRLCKANGGQASAFNVGIPECRGELIAFLDGDDWWVREKLRRVAEVMVKEPSVGMVGHGFIETYNNGDQRVIAEDQPKRFRLDSTSSADTFRCNRGYFGTSRLALRAEIARQILPVPEALVFEADEYVFTLAAALSESFILNAPLTHYRIHGGNLFYCAGTNPNGERKKQQILAALAESLRHTLHSLEVPKEVAASVLELSDAEAAQFRLKLDGGSPWETFHTERTIYRIQFRNEPWKNRAFRALTMIPALLVPPRWFYAGRQWLGHQHWYKRTRKTLLPFPPVGMTEARGTQKCIVHRERYLAKNSGEHRMSQTISPSMPALSASRARLKSKLREFWNSQSAYWDLMTEEIAVSSGNRARAASFVPQGSRILEVACGSAANCVWLLKRGKYFGTDVSQSGLRRAQRTELQLICADAEALPFAEGSFDAVIATYALEHSVCPVKMLSEMVNVVRPGGRIILLGPTWDFPFWYPNALLSRTGNTFWRLWYTVKRTIGQVKALLGGSSPFLVIEEPDAFTQPFVHDSDAVYVVWTYEVIRQMKSWGCKVVQVEVDNQLLGSNLLVKLGKRALMLLPAYRHAGSTSLMVFER